MERQNIMSGIKLLSNSSASPNQQYGKEKDNILSIQQNNIIVKNKHNYKIFKFDCCLGKYETQNEIYDNFCLTMAEDFMNGYDSTFILSGNMVNGTGYNEIFLGKDSQESKGILPRFIDHMTNSINYFSSRKLLLKVSFLEINDEEIIDLLGVRKCKLQIKPEKNHKNAFYVNNLEVKVLQKIDQIQSFYLVGNRKRQYAYSKKYRKRQQSTSFFTIYLESLQDNHIYRRSRFVFCELSSKAFQKSKQLSQEQPFHQSFNSRIIANIQNGKIGFQRPNTFDLSNYSFQNVVNTIVYGEQSAHVSFNDSKVTKLLSQALGGNMKTTILGLIDTQTSAQLQKTFGILKTLQAASQIQNTPSNLKDQYSCSTGVSITQCLNQIHRLSNELDKIKVQFDILVNDSKYVSNQIQKLKYHNGPSITNENEFCSEQHIEDHFLQEKTKKQWQLKLQIKSLEKNLKQKISCIQNFRNDLNDQNQDQSRQNYLNQEKIIVIRKQILLRVKAIKQKRLKSIPSPQTQQVQRQKKRQAFALEIQFQKERNLFTDSIRTLEEKLSFYKQIAQSYLKKQEIQIIKANCKFDETKRTFQLPMFMVKDRKMRALNGKESFGSQRKFIVSPRSKSFNSYHSTSSVRNSGSKGISFQKKIQNILARKPKPSDEYNLEEISDDEKANLNASQKIMAKMKNSTRLKMNGNKSKEATSKINSKKMSFNQETNDRSKEYANNVRSEYELGSVDMDRVLKYNQERVKQKGKQRMHFKNDNHSGPFTLMKRQKLQTEPQIGNDRHEANQLYSPPRSPLRGKFMKSPSNKFKS